MWHFYLVNFPVSSLFLNLLVPQIYTEFGQTFFEFSEKDRLSFRFFQFYLDEQLDQTPRKHCVYQEVINKTCQHPGIK